MVSHRNNFDALRLLGALFVIVGHSSATLAQPPIIVFGLALESLGVVVFFAISGWLIVDAWHRDPRWLVFLRNRALRIFPALAVVVLVMVFVIGPLVTSSNRYFAEPGTWSYLTNLFLWTQHLLPGVFVDNPFPLSVNGPLWTLPIEFLAYLAVPVVALLPFRGRAVAWFVLAVFWAAGYYLIPHIKFFASALNFEGLFWTAFAVAGGLRVLALRRPGIIRLDAGVVVFAALLGLVFVAPQFAVTTTALLLPYVVIALGSRRTPFVWRAARFGDFSYGLYLWGFVVQQLLVSQVRLPQLADAVIVILLTLPVAALSWWLVERPALMLKGRLRTSPMDVAAVVVNDERTAPPVR